MCLIVKKQDSPRTPPTITFNQSDIKRVEKWRKGGREGGRGGEGRRGVVPSPSQLYDESSFSLLFEETDPVLVFHG